MPNDETTGAAPDSGGSSRSEVILSNLLQAGHFDRLETEAKRFLARDPEDASAHFHLTLALIALEKPKEAKHHLDFLLSLAPDTVTTQMAAVCYHSAQNEWAKARIHIAVGLRLDPDCLDFLDDPAAAEAHYREALRIEPDNRHYQRDLFHAVAKRSLVYRLFSIPTRTFTWLGHLRSLLALQPWRVLFLILGFKAVIAFLCWLLLATVVFWPGGKMYEWLLVSEIKRGAAASNAQLRARFWIRRWPAWVRLSLFLGVNLALWSGLFAAIGIPLEDGYAAFCAIVLVHFILICAAWGLRKRRASAARRKIIRRKASPLR